MHKEANAVNLAYKFSNAPLREPATNVRNPDQLDTLFKYAKQFAGAIDKHGKPFRVNIINAPLADERPAGPSGKKVSELYYEYYRY